MEKTKKHISHLDTVHFCYTEWAFKWKEILCRKTRSHEKQKCSFTLKVNKRKIEATTELLLVAASGGGKWLS